MDIDKYSLDIKYGQIPDFNNMLGFDVNNNWILALKKYDTITTPEINSLVMKERIMSNIPFSKIYLTTFRISYIIMHLINKTDDFLVISSHRIVHNIDTDIAKIYKNVDIYTDMSNDVSIEPTFPEKKYDCVILYSNGASRRFDYNLTHGYYYIKLLSQYLYKIFSVLKKGGDVIMYYTPIYFDVGADFMLFILDHFESYEVLDKEEYDGWTGLLLKKFKGHNKDLWKQLIDQWKKLDIHYSDLTLYFPNTSLFYMKNISLFAPRAIIKEDKTIKYITKLFKNDFSTKHNIVRDINEQFVLPIYSKLKKALEIYHMNVEELKKYVFKAYDDKKNFCKDNNIALNYVFDKYTTKKILSNIVTKFIINSIDNNETKLLNMLYATKKSHTVRKFIKIYTIYEKKGIFCYGFDKNDVDIIIILLSIFMNIDITNCDNSLSKYLDKYKLKKINEIMTDNRYTLFKTYDDYIKHRDKLKKPKYIFIMEDITKYGIEFVFKTDKFMSVINPRNYSSTENKHQIVFCHNKSDDYRKRLWDMILYKYPKIDKVKLTNLIDKNSNDLEIYTFITNAKSKQEGGSYYGQVIKNIIQDINGTYDFNYKPQYFLDFGAGTGKKTLDVIKILNIPPENTYAMDLQEFYTVDNTNTQLNYIYYDGITIPTIKNKVNLVTINHVLHHIIDVVNIIDQLEKNYDDECLIIIKEHDCVDSDFAQLIDIEHALWEAETSTLLNFLNNYIARYFTAKELIMLFITRGYVLLKHKSYEPSINITNGTYFTFYKKKFLKAVSM